MKVISKFRDYYDCIQSYGFDDSCIYNRKCEKIEISPIDYPSLRELEKWGGLNLNQRNVGENRNISVNASMLFYCGDIFPILKLSSPECTKIATSVKEFENALNHFVKIKDEMFTKVRKNYNGKMSKWNNDIYNIRKYRIEELFGVSVDVNDLFFDEECPILYWELPSRYSIWSPRTNKPFTLIKNPSLADLCFYRLKTEYEAFIEIRNFITQQLGGNSPKIVNISDKDMIEKKGFDNVTSFRKAPTKRK